MRRFLVVSHRAPSRAANPAVICRPASHLRATYVEQQDRVAQERRATQLARFRLVKRLRAVGRSAQAIMREAGIGRRYVTQWIRLDDLPERNRTELRVGMPEFTCPTTLRRCDADSSTVTHDADVGPRVRTLQGSSAIGSCNCQEGQGRSR